MIKRIKRGKNVVIPHPSLVNLYNCTIGDYTKIAAFVEIQGGVVIGKNCKIEAYAFIPKGTILEEGVLIGPGAILTNDKYPRATTPRGKLKKEKDWNVGPIIIKKGASVGAGAIVLPGITIGRNAMIGAGAVVTRDVTDGATVAGNPARILKKFG